MSKDDFNKYMNGEWMKNNSIPDKYSKWGSFEKLLESTQENVKTIVERLQHNKPSSPVAMLYTSGMDVDQINTDSFQSIVPWLEKVDQLQKDNILAVFSTFLVNGFGCPFGFYAGEDAKDTTTVKQHVCSL